LYSYIFFVNLFSCFPKSTNYWMYFCFKSLDVKFKIMNCISHETFILLEYFPRILLSPVNAFYNIYIKINSIGIYFYFFIFDNHWWHSLSNLFVSGFKEKKMLLWKFHLSQAKPVNHWTIVCLIYYEKPNNNALNVVIILKPIANRISVSTCVIALLDFVKQNYKYVLIYSPLVDCYTFSFVVCHNHNYISI